MRIWFDSVAVEHYSMDPEVWVAIEPRAEASPPQEFSWCIEVVFVEKVYCGEAKAGELGGHRIYLDKKSSWMVVMKAKTEEIQRESHWFWPEILK